MVAKKNVPEGIQSNRTSMYLLYGAHQYRQLKKRTSHKKERFITKYEEKVRRISNDNTLSPPKREQALALSLKALHKQGKKRFWFYKPTIRFFRWGRGSRLRRVYKAIEDQLQRSVVKDFGYYLAKTKLPPASTDYFLQFKNIQRAIDVSQNSHEQSFSIFYGLALAKQRIESCVAKTTHHLAQFEDRMPAYLFLKKYTPWDRDNNYSEFLLQSYETQLHANTVTARIIDNIKNRIHHEISCREVPYLKNICNDIRALLDYNNSENGFLPTVNAMLGNDPILDWNKLDKNTLYSFLVFNLHELAFFLVHELKRTRLWEQMREHNCEAIQSTDYLSSLINQKSDAGMSYHLRTSLNNFRGHYDDDSEFHYEFSELLANSQIENLTCLLLDGNTVETEKQLSLYLCPFVHHRHTITALKKQLNIVDNDIQMGLEHLRQRIENGKLSLKKKQIKMGQQYNKSRYAARMLDPMYQRPRALKLIEKVFHLKEAKTSSEKVQAIFQQSVIRRGVTPTRRPTSSQLHPSQKHKFRRI